MQPTGRKLKKGTFISHTTGGPYDWSNIHIYGQNGIASLVAALSWWRRAAYGMPESGPRERDNAVYEQGRFTQALEDVYYALSEDVS